MDKIYFEMNDKEKQLQHISDTLSYAICMFSEGLCGTGEYNINTEEVIELQSRIADKLISAQNDMILLLKAVNGEEDKPQLVFHPVYGKEDMKELKNCNVYHIEDIENPEDDFYGTEIIFFDKVKGKYINLLQDNDGELSISQWY